MEQAYIYTRVSTAMQAENYSIEAQRTKILEYARNHKISVVREYSDPGYSGKNAAGRPAFMQMFEDIQNHRDKIQYVIAFSLSRFGRNAADNLNYVQLLEDYKICCVFAEKETRSDGADGKLFISVLSAMAELERDNIHVQTMAGRKQKARKGGWNGGFAPYGYALVDGKLVIQEDEAVAVREIYRLYNETNLGFNGVAKRINEQFGKKPRQNGYLTRFSAKQIKDILINPVYNGTLAFGRRVTEKIEDTRNEYHVVKQKDASQIIFAPGQHEAIISKEVWDSVNDKVASNSGRKEKIDKNHEYILSGLLKCPHCGSSMYGVPNSSRKKTNKDGELYRPSYSYKCRNQSRETGHVCPGKVQYSESKIDDAVRDIVMDMVNQENFRDMLLQLSDNHVDADAVKEKIAAIDKDIRKFTVAKTKANNELLNLDYTDPIVDQMEESLNQRLRDAMLAIKEAKDKKEALNIRLLEIGNSEAARKSVYDFLSVFSEIYDELTDAEKKMTMQAFISSIELYPKEAKSRSGQWIKAIHFNFPISYHGAVVEDIEFDKDGHLIRPNQSTDETVVSMTKTERKEA